MPVWLSHKDRPHKETLVYAILDNQSDKSFLLKKTADELSFPFIETHLWLSTMLAENQLVESTKITGLSVWGFRSGESVNLPEIFTREIMPANRDHVPTSEMTRRWSHLKKLEAEIPPLLDCDIALLLGTNVPNVLDPIGYISSKSSDGPFGQRSILGWGIVGIIGEAQQTDSFGRSRYILAHERLQSWGNSVHQSRIVLRSVVKEVFPEQILRTLQTDFHEFIDLSSREGVSRR